MMSFFDLSNKVFLISGASGHLGRAISLRCAAAGAYLYINGRNVDKLQDLSKEISDLGGQSCPLAFDIENEREVENAISIISKEKGRLDGLVNNAFFAQKGSIDSSTIADFQQSFSVNVSALFYLSQQCLPLLTRSRDEDFSSIVNIASMYGVVSPDPAIYGDSGMNNPPFYGASKAAVIQLSRYFAGHVIQRGIRTNSVSPGPFPPDSVKTTNSAFHSELCKKTPMARIGRAEEVAAAVHFLLSSDTSYINGANLPVDGGWTSW